MSVEHKCVPNMELITWNINAVIVVRWPFSSVLEPPIFAMLVTTISRYVSKKFLRGALNFLIIDTYIGYIFDVLKSFYISAGSQCS